LSDSSSAQLRSAEGIADGMYQQKESKPKGVTIAAAPFLGLLLLLIDT
jgi:hypothetical protein